MTGSDYQLEYCLFRYNVSGPTLCLLSRCVEKHSSAVVCYANEQTVAESEACSLHPCLYIKVPHFIAVCNNPCGSLQGAPTTVVMRSHTTVCETKVGQYG